MDKMMNYITMDALLVTNYRPSDIRYKYRFIRNHGIEVYNLEERDVETQG